MIINTFLMLSSTFIVYLDLKYRKIFNIISYPLIFAAIILNIWIFGFVGVFYSLIGLFAGFFTWYIAYRLNFSGYGEFKLLALIGILKGYYFVLFVGFISYGLISTAHIIYLIQSGNIKILVQNSRTYLDLIFQYGFSIWTILEDHLERLIIPYSVVILIAIFIELGLGL